MQSISPDYEQLFRTHYGPLVRALTLTAGSADDAADAVQDAFVQLHRHWGKAHTIDEPVAWLRRTATNRVIDEHRRAGRRKRTLTVLQNQPATATTGLDDLWDDVRELPERQRTAVGLYYLGGLPVAEVADTMGIAEGTVKSLLADARRNLRHRLEVIDCD